MLPEIAAFGKLIGLDTEDKTKCCSCKQPFTSENVFTQAGWKETKISGMCEKCFDSLFSDEDE